MLQTDELDELLYGLGEDDKEPFNENFELAGHESNLFILSFGTPFYILKVMILILLVKQCFVKRPSVYSKLHSLAS